MRQRELRIDADLVIAADDVHIQGARSPPFRALPAGRFLRRGGQAHDLAGGCRRDTQQHGVQVVILLGAAHRRRLEHAGDSQAAKTAGREDVHAELKISHPVAQVAAQRQDHGTPAGLAGHGRSRRIVTAMSVNCWRTGAWGLWTVTSAACTISSARQAVTSLSASVSISMTGSPATILASRSAMAP